MDGLLQICDDEGIDVHFLPLTRSQNILGWYYRTRDNDPVIALDESLKRNRPLGRTVLGEEIAHHQTTPVGTLAGKYLVNNHANRWRDESRAVRRATEILIPCLELRDVLRREPGPIDARLVTELADRFIVMPWLVWRKLHFLRINLNKREGLQVAIRSLGANILLDALWGTNSPCKQGCCRRIECGRRKAVS